MCNNCGLPPWMCTCKTAYYSQSPCGCPKPCGCSNGICPIKLDASCIIYHKNGSEISELLEGLELQNGATLELILETIDDYIKQIKVGTWTLPYLVDSEGYTINTLEQFADAVDQELGLLNHFKGNVSADPSSLNDGDYWWRTDLAAASALKIRVNGTTRTITTS